MLPFLVAYTFFVCEREQNNGSLSSSRVINTQNTLQCAYFSSREYTYVILGMRSTRRYARPFVSFVSRYGGGQRRRAGGWVGEGTFSLSDPLALSFSLCLPTIDDVEQRRRRSRRFVFFLSRLLLFSSFSSFLCLACSFVSLFSPIVSRGETRSFDEYGGSVF